VAQQAGSTLDLVSQVEQLERAIRMEEPESASAVARESRSGSAHLSEAASQLAPNRPRSAWRV